MSVSVPSSCPILVPLQRATRLRRFCTNRSRDRGLGLPGLGNELLGLFVLEPLEKGRRCPRCRIDLRLNLVLAFPNVVQNERDEPVRRANGGKPGANLLRSDPWLRHHLLGIKRSVMHSRLLLLVATRI